MLFDLKDLFEKQEKLDAEIHQKHNETYKSTFQKRLLSYLVEVGEFANSTRCFKFWSNKGPEEKARVLDEYADGLHFILSIGIALDYQFDTIDVDEPEDKEGTNLFLNCYSEFIKFSNEITFENYIKAFTSFLQISYFLEISSGDLSEAYYKKLEVNYIRQENNY